MWPLKHACSDVASAAKLYMSSEKSFPLMGYRTPFRLTLFSMHNSESGLCSKIVYNMYHKEEDDTK